MKPVVVVLGMTYADARQYVLAHQDTRPLLQGARIASAHAPHALRGLIVDKVIETPAARLGRGYTTAVENLAIGARKSARPLQ